MRYKVYTNKTFESYINRLYSNKKYEDRYDTLDLEDITADDVEIPSDDEVNAAVRELDLFDDVAAAVGATDIGNKGGELRILDFDDKGKSTTNRDGDRPLDIDFDDVGNNVADNDDGDALEIDLDDKGKAVRSRDSGLGSLGMLDYDDDIDVSNVVASIDDVYTALMSDDASVVKSMIKRYAPDIKDAGKIKNAMLAQAIKLNISALKPLCGVMNTALSPEEKELRYIDEEDINDALSRFNKIATKLTGENNEYGLIPNAIVSCEPNTQTLCMYVIRFLNKELGLPILPIYFRGAVLKKCYALAKFLYNKLPDGSIDEGLLTGARGLLTRIKNQEDVPDDIVQLIVKAAVDKKMPSRIIGDALILALRNNSNKAFNYIRDNINFDSSKGDAVIDYVDGNDAVAYEILKDKLNLDY